MGFWREPQRTWLRRALFQVHLWSGLAVGLYSSAYYIGGSLGAALPSLFWDSGGWTACVVMVVVVQAATLAVATGFWTPPVAQSPPGSTGRVMR